MRSTTKFTVGAFLTATLASVALADGPWVNVVTADGIQAVPGLDAVWVPNQFNNPTIDSNGFIYFRGQFAGPGITTANSRGIFRVADGTFSLIAREGSPLPGDLLPGLVINTTAGTNGLSSANMITGNGGVIVAGSANGPGVTASNNDFNAFVSASGTASLLAREGDAYPGAAGVTMTVAQLSSGTYCDNNGAAIASVTLAGTGVVTTAGAAQNNSAVVVYSPSGTQVVFRRGDAAPGAGAGDNWTIPAGTVMQQDTFGLFKNGDMVGFSGTLLNTDGSVPTSADKVYLVNTGTGLRIFAREASEIPGFPGITFKDTSSPVAWGNHPIRNDGAVLFLATLGGAVTPTVDDSAIMLEHNGVYSVLLRRGDSIPGIDDGLVYSTPNTSAFLMNASGLLCYQGILMNPDGTAAAANATYVGYRKADGTKGMIIRQGQPVPGFDGATFGSLNGSTSICLSDAGICVFSANAIGGAFGKTGGSAIMAWDEVNGVRVLAKTGDTNFTGTPVNQISLIGSTGNNGNGHNSGISPSGKLTLRAGDSVNAVYTIATIQLDAGSSGGCAADLNADGTVGADDLAALLNGWGGTSPDLTGDGIVTAEDLAVMLSAWGACP
jgi:hypothetical protein